MILLCLTAALICASLALFPLTAYPWTLTLLPRRAVTRGPEPAPDEPITLCFCAYNEERVLPAKLENIRRLKERYPGLRVLAYVDGATDRTAEILRAEPLLVDTHVASVRRGKSHGMNLLASKATSDIVAFTDANVILDEAALGRLGSWFASPEVGCVCGHLVYVSNTTATAETGSLQWRIEELTKARESASGSVMGADGSLFAVRRSLLRPVPDHLIDDMFRSLDILCRGYRVVHAGDVEAYEEAPSDAQVECRRKIRIACQAFNVHRALWPRLRKLAAVDLYKYVSHRILRWLSPFLLAAALLLAIIASCLLLGIAATVAGFGAGAALFWLCLMRGWKPARMVYAAGASLIGVGVGVWHSLRGEQFVTWRPTSSAEDAAKAPGRSRKIVYLAHDLDDAKVRSRIAELKACGGDIVLASFRRAKVTGSAPQATTIDLGLTRDYAYLQRAFATIRAVGVLWRSRRSFADAELVLARNFEPALLTLAMRRLVRQDARIVYEALDVHRFLVGDRPLNKLFRLLERIVLERVDLLLVSSSAFVTEHYQPVQGYSGRWYVAENKIPRVVVARLRSAAEPTSAIGAMSGRPVWTIGWFGMLRCHRSLALIKDQAASMPDRLRFVIHGFPTEWSPEEFADRISKIANVAFHGPFKNPDDLATLYGSVDLVWALDYYDTGGNSDWLLPNRLYEAGFFGVPLLARAGTTLGDRITELQMGWTIKEPARQGLHALFEHLDMRAYRSVRAQIQELPRSLFVEDGDLLDKIDWACGMRPPSTERLSRESAA